MSPLAILAEERIQEAIDSGEFENLEGAGKPLDLNQYFAAPSEFRAGFNLLKNARAVPPEVEAMRQVNVLREQIVKVTDPAILASLRLELLTRQTEVAMALERVKLAIKADATY